MCRSLESLRHARCFVAAVHLAVLSTLHTASHAELTAVLLTGALDLPLYVTAAPGDPDRLFVCELAGTIRIVDKHDGTVFPTPFLDLAGLVVTDINPFVDQGLLGLAFHPEYQTNGHFFVYYTDDPSAPNPSSAILSGFNVVIARYTVSDTNPNEADPNSAEIFLLQQEPWVVHNGGMLAFLPGDPNHYLYAGLGDGSVGFIGLDDTAQLLTSRLGKILRIDVDRGPGNDPSTPFAPPDNPFVDGVGPNEDLIWAYGLREPWRFSFDPDGNMYIGDVGEVSIEEIDFLPASSGGGQNYGWRLLEGSLMMDCVDCDLARATTDLPIHEYASHGTGDHAVIGGYVYRGSAIPYLQGQYVFGDFAGRIWTMIHDPSQPVMSGVNPTPKVDRTLLLNPTRLPLTSFGEDNEGELYYVTQAGELFQITDPAQNPCTDEALIRAQHTAFRSMFRPELDSDADGLPEEAAVALIIEAACMNDESPIWTATINAYDGNLQQIDAETQASQLLDFREALAAMMAVSPTTQAAVTATFKGAGITLGGLYRAVLCLQPELCEPASPLRAAKNAPDLTRASRGPDNPFSGEGDPDGDGVTNAEEFANVKAAGRGIAAFVNAAFDATLDGTERASSGGNRFNACFIATAAYGTPLAAEIDALREFRDRSLLANPFGAAFVDTYYRLSPPIAERIAQHSGLRRTVRVLLVPLVAVPTLEPRTFLILIALAFFLISALVTRPTRRET